MERKVKSEKGRNKRMQEEKVMVNNLYSEKVWLICRSIIILGRSTTYEKVFKILAQSNS